MTINDEHLNVAAKAVYEAQGMHLSTGREWDGATPGDRHYATVYANAALSAVGYSSKPAIDTSSDVEIDADEEASPGFSR